MNVSQELPEIHYRKQLSNTNTREKFGASENRVRNRFSYLFLEVRKKEEKDLLHLV